MFVLHSQLNQFTLFQTIPHLNTLKMDAFDNITGKRENASDQPAFFSFFYNVFNHSRGKSYHSYFNSTLQI